MEEIFEKVLELISIYGAPVEWLSDNGKEFVNELLEKLCKVFKINRRFTSPYNPRAIGLTERFNQTLVSSLRKQAADDPNNWAKYLPLVLIAYRSRVHSSTNFSPYEILFGYKISRGLKYLVKWKNKPVSKNSWVKGSDFYDKVVLDNYHRKLEENSKRKKSKQNNNLNITTSLIYNNLTIFSTTEGLSLVFEPDRSSPIWETLNKIPLAPSGQDLMTNKDISDMMLAENDYMKYILEDKLYNEHERNLLKSCSLFTNQLRILAKFDDMFHTTSDFNENELILYSKNNVINNYINQNFCKKFKKIEN
ncbi:unnamed protein product [Brachionus calyciflorus]|uniref:Integrase catalytic domain-containing protein n=1 Tax=Brachionus calyciflorus TaxID=104777 RepID=A0A814KET7_9BILA|nr:unnamed protein product [Brachionus calyciflorus]